MYIIDAYRIEYRPSTYRSREDQGGGNTKITFPNRLKKSFQDNQFSYQEYIDVIIINSLIKNILTYVWIYFTFSKSKHVFRSKES